MGSFACGEGGGRPPPACRARLRGRDGLTACPLQVRKSYKKRFCSLSMGRLDYFLDLNDGKDVKKLEHKGAFELVDVTLVLCRETYELLRASAKKGKEGELPEGLPDDQADAKEEGAEKKKGGGFMSMFKVCAPGSRRRRARRFPPFFFRSTLDNN